MNGPLIKEYDPIWAKYFEELKLILAKKLGSLILDIHHVGSTAVPGLSAKAVVDFDIVMKNYDGFPEIVSNLEKLGYSHEGDKGVLHREAFRRANENVPNEGSGRKWINHHLYVCPINSKELSRHLKFRDFLRSSELARKKYAKIKRRIAVKAKNDENIYAKLKEVEAKDFIEGILQEV